MDWKAISNIVAFAGLLVAMVVMFNQVNTCIDRLQAETNARFDAVNKRFDDVLEAIVRSFDRRVSHLEGRLDAQSAE